MKSFKQMTLAGEVKRADALQIRLDDIHEEPGFNLREEGPELDASIDALAAHIKSGGIIPPLEVRPREAGGVFLVDGHRRRRALIKVRDSGEPIEWVRIVPFAGNDADRVARIITSAEGRNLTPLEVARGYSKLAAFGLTPAEIATKVGKTRQHVDQLMILIAAPTKVQKMVAAGQVSASTAIAATRHHGDGAGEILAGQLQQAESAGKKKVTAASIAGKTLRQAVREFVQSVPRPGDGQDTITIPAAAFMALVGMIETNP